MTRVLDARSTELSERLSLAPILLVKLTTFTDRTAETVDTIHYYSTRPLRYDYGNTGTTIEFEPYIINIGDISDQMDHLPGQNAQLNLGRDLTLTFSNPKLIGSGDAYLSQTLSDEGVESGRVEVAQLLVDRAKGEDFFDLKHLTGDEHVVFYRGEVDRWGSINNMSFDLECIAEIPSFLAPHIVSDITISDPKDIGKEIPTVYGSVKRMPLINWEIGWTTTTGTMISANHTGNMYVADNTGFNVPCQAWIGGELVNISSKVVRPDGYPIEVVISARGLMPAAGGPMTTAVMHSAGETIVEVLTGGITLVVADGANAQVQLLYVRNPATGELTLENAIGAYTITPANTTLIPGRTVTSLNIVPASVDYMLAALALQAKITQQPIVTDFGATNTTFTGEKPTSGTVAAYDGNLLTSAPLGTSGSSNITQSFNFTNHTGENVSGVLHLNFGSPLGGRYTYGPSSIAQTVLMGGGVFAVPYTHDTLQIRFIIDTFGATGKIIEITRDITSQISGGARITTDTISQGQSQGYGLEFYADVRGAKVPAGDTSYTVGASVLIESSADIVRHMLQVGCGLSAIIDETQWAIAESRLTLNKHAFIRQELGDNLEDVVSALGFESRSQLIQAEEASGTKYRMLCATNPSIGVYSFNAATRTLTEWESASEDGRSLSNITTRWSAMYALDRSRVQSGEEPFDEVLNVSVDESDVPGITTANMTTAEATFGPRPRPLVLLPTIADQTTAERVLGYHVVEGKRVASIISLTGVPWVEAYDLEIGDIVDVGLDWWAVATKRFRIIQYTKRSSDELADITLVEVT